MSSNIHKRVIELVPLSEQELEELANHGVTDTEDLMYFQDEDWDAMNVKNAKSLKCLKLVANYLRCGGEFEESTGILEMMNLVAEKSKQTTVNETSMMVTTPKIVPNFVSTYNGDLLEWEDWERETENTLGQYHRDKYLHQPPVSEREKAEDQQFYYALANAVNKGVCRAVVEKAKKDHGPSGYAAWQALKTWRNSDEQKTVLINRYQTQVEGLILDESTTVSKYINDWESLVLKLDELGGGYREQEKKNKFLRGIVDESYNSIKNYIISEGQDKFSFDELLKKFKRLETSLDENADIDTSKKARRAGKSQTKVRQVKVEESSGSKYLVPKIPRSILFKLRPEFQHDLKVWRECVNSGKEWNQSKAHSKHLSFFDSEHAPRSNSPKKKRSAFKGNDRGGSSTQGEDDRFKKPKIEPDLEEDTSNKNKIGRVTTKLRKIDVPLEPVSFALFSPSKNEKKVVEKKNVRMVRSHTGTTEFRVVLDTGASGPVIGGEAWEIVHLSNEKKEVNGAIKGMGEMILSVGDGITAIPQENGPPILIGVGGATIDPHSKVTEALLNSHSVRKNGFEINDTHTNFGGGQYIKVGGKKVRMEFDNVEDAMYLNCRPPTPSELKTLKVEWLYPKSNEGVSIVRREKDGDIEKWSRRFSGILPKNIVKQTVKNTTQFVSFNPSDEDVRRPRRNLLKRDHALVPYRLEGRVDSDTFFSSVRSIRGFRCVQLFVQHVTNFIYVKCLQFESQSHAALQDFIRKVGAPELLVTDNSQTQTGKKWTETCRQYCIDQGTTEPDNQNQNFAERMIQEVKRLVGLMLQNEGAPDEFWCYALEHTVDLWVHTSKASLNYKTPMEMLTGNSVDISPFRFAFWQPVWIFLTNEKFPRSRRLPGRFLGVNRTCGDSFTYRVWLLTHDENGNYEGKELTRSTVYPRKVDADGSEDSLEEIGWTLSTNEKEMKIKNKVAGKRPNSSTESGSVEGATKKKKVRFNDPATMGPYVVGQKNDQFVASRTEKMKVDEMDLMVDQNIADSTSVDNLKPSDQEEIHKETGVNDTESEEEEESQAPDFDPREEPFDAAYEANNHFDGGCESSVGGDKVIKIIDHQKKDGSLHLQVLWQSGVRSWELLRDMKEDYTHMTAEYIINHYQSEHSKGESGDRLLQWAKKTIRDVSRALRRLHTLYDMGLDENNNVVKIRKTQQNSKKKKKQQSRWKYGVQVPRNVQEALEFDKKNNNNLWWEAIEKEMTSLVDMDCFEFLDDTSSLDESYQKTRLWLIFDVKTDLRRKARLVAGGNMVEVLEGVNSYSTTVKQISVRLLEVIAHKEHLDTLSGDVGNAYINAFTSEKVYSVAGPEFGPKLKGKIVVIKKALYGLVTSAERWHAHFSDTLRSLGFSPTRYDRDVWLRQDGRGKYEYIAVHVDDFKIFSKKPNLVMEAIKKIYTIKNVGKDDYFLGGEYSTSKSGTRSIGCQTYLKESISRVEAIFGVLEKADTPMIKGDHPEMDESAFLQDEDHKKYQMLIGMLVWIVSLGRFDCAYATVSMSRFLAVPRKGHLERVLRIFRYLKKRMNRRIIVDSRDIIVEEGAEQLLKDFRALFEEFYPDAYEEIDPNLPEPLMSEMTITVFHDSDHAHDVVTRRSITGIIIILGRTPVIWISKRQGAIETSTFGAEFSAAKSAVEELLTLRYMLRCLGVKVTMPSFLVGDNKGMITNVSVPESPLKKKHNAIAYHKVRECMAAGIAHALLTTSNNNWSDMMTKALGVNEHNRLINNFNPH